MSADLDSRSQAGGLRRWAVEFIAAAGCFVANVICHALWQLWDFFQIPTIGSFPITTYFRVAKADLPLGTLIRIGFLSILVGVLLGLGLGRIWIQRRFAVLVFVAGALVSVGGFLLLSALKELGATPAVLWTVMLIYTLGMPLVLGRTMGRVAKTRAPPAKQDTRSTTTE